MPRCKYCGKTYRLRCHVTYHERRSCRLRPGEPGARQAGRVAGLDTITDTLIAQIRAARQADSAATALLERRLHEVRHERALVMRGRV
jgi:hypothetical protein